ncbi:DUF6777 domain-containing protein [Williamsia phyllosphaerae]|uniref:DUF6777 domain-containing protein n=1 Tax=Williamsia phyllosphaerae TaxID=885042 RepID=A0ABQ1URP6_9NOCA|nr:DUF6777 domain-containing protein [Williamsia phyllosphaerae]GGF23569.1 hypothetical protein GCM10007298_19390 [Williamsia phyllosphaerae]
MIVSALAVGLAIGVLVAGAGIPLGWYRSPGPSPTMLTAVTPGPEAFGANFASAAPPSSEVLARLRATTPQPLVRGAVDGSGRGLYGGSLDNSTCNADGVLAFLQNDPAKRSAWLAAVGVSEANLESYLTGLTSVILLNDTWVTNHGYRNGSANPFQSVLQAGTAVLVDQQGVPRVRCACGNPLTEAEPRLADPAGARRPWDGYDDSSVTRVNPGQRFDTIRMVDIATGSLVERGIGIGRAGRVQVSLIWSTDADLDVHVIDPQGFEIYFERKVAPSGGQLDLDTIPQQGFTAQHIENIYWDTQAPAGRYTAFIRDFNSYDTAASPYQMKIFVGGALVRDQSGALVDGQDGATEQFSVNG